MSKSVSSFLCGRSTNHLEDLVELIDCGAGITPAATYTTPNGDANTLAETALAHVTSL